MSWGNEPPFTHEILNKNKTLQEICRELARKNETLFHFVLQNLKEDPFSGQIAFMNYGVHNRKKYWFFRHSRWSKELTKKNHALLEYIFQKIRTELKKFDEACKPPAPADMEKMDKHWQTAKKIMLELKKGGFETEARDFLKKEKRSKKLLQEPE